MFRRAICGGGVFVANGHSRIVRASTMMRLAHTKSGGGGDKAAASTKLICEAPVEYTSKRTFFGGRASAVIPAYQVRRS